MTRLHLVLSLGLGVILGCGGAQSGAPTTASRAERPEPFASRAAPEARPAMQTHGLTGSLAAAEVRRALAPKYAEFAGCFTSRAARLPMLAGRVTLTFHVATDGRVASVHPVDSTVGHRDAERCIVDVAASVRFPRPQGGEADFTWPLEMDPPDGVREAITWDPGRVSHIVRARGRRVLARCGAEGADIQVTTYVSRRGRVISAGAASPNAPRAASLDCVANAVRTWRMPRSPRRRAKVTFDLRVGG